MKKVSAISIASFYLLLTTGLYVCILHCAADYFLGTQPVQTAGHPGGEGHPKGKQDGHHASSDQTEQTSHKQKDSKECGGDADCSCCNQHGQYAVKENIQTGSKSYLPVAALLPGSSRMLNGSSASLEIIRVTWPQGHAPPAASKEPLYISYRSLLI